MFLRNDDVNGDVQFKPGNLSETWCYSLNDTGLLGEKRLNSNLLIYGPVWRFRVLWTFSYNSSHCFDVTQSWHGLNFFFSVESLNSFLSVCPQSWWWQAAVHRGVGGFGLWPRHQRSASAGLWQRASIWGGFQGKWHCRCKLTANERYSFFRVEGLDIKEMLLSVFSGKRQ